MNHLSIYEPTVSVIMAVKNGGDYIHQSLNSVIKQTFSDFEIIVINDGSEDNTLAIVESLNDSRIRVYSQKNRGVARAANRGLALARGKYIARIDHDDLWFPERLEKQLAYLTKNPEIVLVGSAAVILTENGYSERKLEHPTLPAEINWDLLFNNPFVHSSIIFRKDVIKKIGLYFPGPDITPLDDYNFISRISEEYQVANLQDVLVGYRESPLSLTSDLRSGALQSRNKSLAVKLAKISSENIAKLNNLSFSDKTCINFGSLMHQTGSNISFFDLRRIEFLLMKSADRISSIFQDGSWDKDRSLNIRMPE
jgi:glycosyltransferase involved in cell wall biosynthesis